MKAIILLETLRLRAMKSDNRIERLEAATELI